MQVEVVQSRTSYLWHFRILRDDGGLIATSLGHVTITECETALQVLLDNINSASIIFRKEPVVIQ